MMKEKNYTIKQIEELTGLSKAAIEKIKVPASKSGKK